ncbi:MAG: lipocalin family protein [Verrucomicrobiaceae bacterium]|nr:lipocalin family protein [Verrucomicrobiaceae bacterium]
MDAANQEAIVGTPVRKYLWMLSRTATIPESRYAALVTKAINLGHDVSRLVKDAQRCLPFCDCLPR